jgi:hypothetical protein
MNQKEPPLELIKTWITSVIVELKRAIGRGDEVCHFLVYYNELVE